MRLLAGRPLRVTLAVPTFRRPVELSRLLAALPDQQDALRSLGQPVVLSTLVIDNDPAGSAGATVAAYPSVRYVHEPQPGLAAVRNCALQATGTDDALVFIDDDETPAPGWLAALLGSWLRTGATGVAGPVVSDLPADLDPWIAAGGFFARSYRRGLVTDAPIREAATSNLLLDLATVRAAGLRFDPGFGLSGGEDSLFTRQLSRRGPLAWCAEAVVHDPVAAARLTRSWVCRRALSSANSAALVDLVLDPSARTRVRVLGNGLLRVGAGALLTVVGRLTGSTSRSARGVRACWRGAGLLLGGLGLAYLEYGRGRRWRWAPSPVSTLGVPSVPSVPADQADQAGVAR